MAWRGTNERRLSAMQIFGIMIMAVGLIMMIGFGVSSIKNAYRKTDTSQKNYIELDDEAESYSGEVFIKENKNGKIALLFCGALFIFAGVPFFYMPYADGGLMLRMKTKKKDSEKEEEITADPEFDYPDEDFDFIIRREIYEMNHREQLENIRKKHSRK